MTHLTLAQQQAAIRAAVATVPPVFGLREFPGNTFRLGAIAAQRIIAGAEVELVVQIDTDEGWRDFGRTTALVIRRELAPVDPPVDCLEGFLFEDSLFVVVHKASGMLEAIRTTSTAAVEAAIALVARYGGSLDDYRFRPVAPTMLQPRW